MWDFLATLSIVLFGTKRIETNEQRGEQKQKELYLPDFPQKKKSRQEGLDRRQFGMVHILVDCFSLYK
jgi:hypothetical protein